jgi:hypothetical protein
LDVKSLGSRTSCEHETSLSAAKGHVLKWLPSRERELTPI